MFSGITGDFAPLHMCSLFAVRLGNFHEPQAGVDVTKTETLRRNGGTISRVRIRNMDDRRRIIQTKSKSLKSSAHAAIIDEVAGGEPQDHTVN